MSADGLTGFDQFWFRGGVLFQFVTPEYEIEEPDNKTIGEQQQYWSENRTVESQAVPDVSHFQRDQRAGGEDHQKLGPAFLHINADPFGKKHTAIKERQNSSSVQRAPGQDVLQFVEQKNDRFAVSEQKLIVRPIRNLIEPKRSEKPNRKSNTPLKILKRAMILR